jgi:hypothetical protein
VQVEQRGPGTGVAHACHQLLKARSGRRGEDVAGMAQVVKVNFRKGPVPWRGSTSTRTRPPSPRDGGQHDQSAEPLGFRWGSWTEQGQELTFAGACQ